MAIKLGTTINASHLIRKNYSEFIVSKFQIFDVKITTNGYKNIVFQDKQKVYSFIFNPMVLSF